MLLIEKKRNESGLLRFAYNDVVYNHIKIKQFSEVNILIFLPTLSVASNSGRKKLKNNRLKIK